MENTLNCLVVEIFYTIKHATMQLYCYNSHKIEVNFIHIFLPFLHFLEERFVVVDLHE